MTVRVSVGRTRCQPRVIRNGLESPTTYMDRSMGVWGDKTQAPLSCPADARIDTTVVVVSSGSRAAGGQCKAFTLTTVYHAPANSSRSMHDMVLFITHHPPTPSAPSWYHPNSAPLLAMWPNSEA